MIIGVKTQPMSDALSLETDRIQRFYDEYVKDHGISAGWATIEDANNTYKTASSCSAQDWKSFQTVLDVGSGQGHLLRFLRQERNFTGSYTGIELLDLFHNKAVGLYGDMSDARFIHHEFLDYDFGSECFDWVISLGSFSVKQENQEECDVAFCRKMIELANHGVSIFLNDINNMRPGRLKEVPDLAAHDIDQFVAMVQKNFKVSNIEVKHYPEERSQPTMLHLVL